MDGERVLEEERRRIREGGASNAPLSAGAHPELRVRCAAGKLGEDERPGELRENEGLGERPLVRRMRGG
jgi:hypothetical protein